MKDRNEEFVLLDILTENEEKSGGYGAHSMKNDGDARTYGSAESQSKVLGASEESDSVRANNNGACHRRCEYKDSFPKQMYTFFTAFSDAGVPSFSKFARSLGVTLSELESFRENFEFERAYKECSEIRRDYLIDNALTKRYDSSFTKYLLSYEYGMDESGAEDPRIDVTVEVID
jgi:hypothetical protein